jgi:hypothetical protein
MDRLRLCRLSAVLSACALAAACARFDGPGSQDDFMRVRAECYRSAMTVVSGTNIDQFSGRSNSQTMPSCAAFTSCLAGRGYQPAEEGRLVVPPGFVAPCSP